MLSQFKRFSHDLILRNPRARKLCAMIGAKLNASGVRLIWASRQCVRFMNHHVTHEGSDWFVDGLRDLHRSIDQVLVRQREEYGNYYYFYGYPYQSLSILNIYGERSTEERFDSYGLRELVRSDDVVLDIGCNCGFLALYTSFRTGCRAEGVDINPYMIEIGNLCARYLRVDDRVRMTASRIQDYAPQANFTVLFSFATHWTDDANYRVPLREHFERCAAYLVSGGRLLFETHAADVGNESFYEAMKTMGDLFVENERRDSDKGARHLYVLTRR